MDSVTQANGIFGTRQVAQAAYLPPQSRWNEAQLTRLYQPCQKYSRQTFVGQLLMHLVLWMVAIAYFYQLARPELGDGGVIGPGIIYIFFMGLLAAPVTARWSTERRVKALLKHRWTEYHSHFGGGLSPNSRILVTVLTPLLGLLAAAGIYAGSRSYAAFTEETIVISRLFEDTRVYGYHQVSEIRAVAHRTAPNGEIIPLRKSYYEIEFSDGRLWTTAEGLRNSAPRSDHKTIAFASRQSGLLIAGPVLYRTCAGAPLSKPIAQ